MPKTARLSQDALQLLDGGVNVPNIARLFKMDPKTVRTRLGGAKVFAKREGVDYYQLRDVAQYLVALPADVVQQVLRMNHMDLPPMLKKEYWTGQMQMLKVKEQEGELWRTEAVLEYVGQAFKDIRMQIMLTSDTVEREMQLTEKQRAVVKSLLDTMMESIRGKLLETFAARRGDPEGSHAGNGELSTSEPRELTIEEQCADL